MGKRDGGYIVVETTVSFMLLVLLMVSILSLINVTVVQARVHYALTQTANELSMYSYVIDALGLTKDIKALDKTGQEVQKTIDGVLNDLDTIEHGITTVPSNTTEFFDNLDAVQDAVSSLSGTAQTMIENPKETFVNVVRYGMDRGKNWGMQELVMRPMLDKYLRNGSQSARDFLESYGIKDELDLSKSVFIDSNGDITLVASYEIDYTFGILPLPFTKLYIEQTVKTKAWLGGAE